MIATTVRACFGAGFTTAQSACIFVQTEQSRDQALETISVILMVIVVVVLVVIPTAVIVAEVVSMPVIAVTMLAMMIVLQAKISSIAEVTAASVVEYSRFDAAGLHQISSDGACHDAAPSSQYYDLLDECKYV
jgi:hypothetical protein